MVVAANGGLTPSTISSTLALVQDTVYMDLTKKYELQQEALAVTGEWPVKVIYSTTSTFETFLKGEKVCREYTDGLTTAERRTPLPDDPGTRAGFCLPGEEPSSIKENCGQVYAVLWCSTCNPGKDTWAGEKKHSCNNRLCPQCSRDWLHRQSEEISDRLSQLRAAVGYPARHIIFSPDPEMIYQPIKWLRKECYRLMDLAGVVGSLVVMHLWRFRDLEGQEIAWKWCSLNPEAQTNIDKQNKLFEDNHSKYSAPYEKPVPCRRFYYPHFHVLGWGWLMDSDEFHKISGGWIYKNKSDTEKSLRRTKKEFYTTARYMLSHAGIKKRAMTYVYRGFAHYSKWDIASEWSDIEPMECKKCETQLTQINLKKDGTHGTEEPAETVVRHRLYDWKQGEPPPGIWEKFSPPVIEDGLDFSGHEDPQYWRIEYVDIDD